MQLLGWLLVVFVLAVLAACLWRFFTLRSKGYPVVVRRLPSEDGRHWRHGVLVFNGISVKFYKLRSIKPDSNLVLTRLATDVVGRREITDRERVIMEPNMHVLELRHGSKERWEVALDSEGDTAMVSWLESAPSARRDRHSAFNNPQPM
ncbi:MULTISPECIES: DUF2550 domain-containing protein [Corynebacterium]|uniref:Secreted protein n=1 Tax=Corynebacterium auriscanis TaxID=99807 RepID=A0A0A2DLC4_9CORY|nr:MULTISPECIES: DUF2550 domain-containing protein [Corynebacterium]KGM18734.1 hypothetical protein MA47_05345 [Corynebacterium auriscanis]OFT90724.1 hypothetical protein HMPREF3098_02355 [Corynebacterium sp. HMSC28B08]WJY73065.1 hypothetical protein CAURIC_07230 [Corynebacterium auriscanis]